MRSNITIGTALSLIVTFSAHASAGISTTSKATANVAKQLVQQSSSGCGSPNIVENSGKVQIQITAPCYNINVWGLKTRMNSLEINQERLLLAQHPTELRITNAYLRRWLPDDQRLSLTLEFENPRDIPIPEVEIDFLDPESGGSISALKPIPFTQSKVYREAGSHKFSLAAGGKTALPVAFLDEIENRQPHDPDSCPFDAALTLDTPVANTALSSHAQPSGGSIQTLHRPLLVRARFKSIFEQQLSSTQWVWIVYGRGSESMQFWYPSKKSWDTLRCAG